MAEKMTPREFEQHQLYLSTRELRQHADKLLEQPDRKPNDPLSDICAQTIGRLNDSERSQKFATMSFPTLDTTNLEAAREETKELFMRKCFPPTKGPNGP